jgi:hypothetical protein
MYVSRAVISNEPFDAISASSDLSHSSRFSPRELIVDLKTLISALAAAADANLPGEARLIAGRLFAEVIGRMEEPRKARHAVLQNRRLTEGDYFPR